MSSLALALPVETPNVKKSPGADLAYGFDWNALPVDDGPWLQPGDSISTSSWSVTPNDGTLQLIDLGIINNKTMVRLKGGTINRIYVIKNSVSGTLALPTVQSDERSIIVEVVQK